MGVCKYMLEKEKNRRINEADFNQWSDGIKKAVRQVGDK